MMRKSCQFWCKSSPLFPCCIFKSTSSRSLNLVNDAVMHHRRDIILTPTVTFARSSLHTTTRTYGLMEFFDDDKNWEKLSVQVGRAWKKSELRGRSNEELHKLWYVLLKEMNMLLTMQAEYERLKENWPAPERLEKVEVSLDNLRDVIDERNKALSLLETGELPHPKWIDDMDEIGRPIRRLEEEHLIPKEENKEFLKKYEHLGQWTEGFRRLYNEKELRKQSYYKACSNRLYRKLLNKYPHLTDDKEFLKEYCDQNMIPTDPNPDVEKLIQLRAQQDD